MEFKDLIYEETYQASCFESLFGTDEQQEGVKAFIEKNAPILPRDAPFLTRIERLAV